MYVMGFATPAWSKDDHERIGLWEHCICNEIEKAQDWFHAVQAMIAIGLIFLLLALIAACIYLCVHAVSKNTTIVALIILCFLGVLFMVIGFIIYGVKANNLSWSFALTVLGAVFTLLAGILSFFQMRESGVHI